GSKSASDVPFPSPEPVWTRGLATPPVPIGVTTAAPRGSSGPLPPSSAAADDGPGGPWSQEAFGFLTREEYHFSRAHDGSWSAPNRAHDLRTKLVPGSVELTSRVEGADVSAGGWWLRLRLTGLGRPATLSTVPPGEVEETSGGRIQSRRPAITEWYRNDEAGLEQGFTIASAPDGARAIGRGEDAERA